jgi:hypothetical protein
MDVAIPPGSSLTYIDIDLEDWCVSAGLRLTLKGTLAKYPGCIHWHFKRGRERGTEGPSKSLIGRPSGGSGLRFRLGVRATGLRRLCSVCKVR